MLGFLNRLKDVCVMVKHLFAQLAEKDAHIAELKAQIEKMKCCPNCKHHNVDCGGFKPVLCNADFRQGTSDFSGWELKQEQTTEGGEKQ